MALLECDLSGTPCTLDFRGFDQPLGVAVGTLRLTLPPWTYRRHMDSLRLCTRATDAGLRLDSATLCAAVLAGLDVDDARGRLLAPVALWWAAGGDAPLPPAPADGDWLDLGSARARLRPWTEHQRLAALNASLAGTRDTADGEDAEAWFDPVSYLDAMVRASLVALDGPADLDALDARATAALLHACVALNVPDEDTDPLLQGGPAARECAARTLRLCQALGWTPARVWATPAAEVDRLLRLLDLLQPPARPPTSGRRGLARHPDATVIRIEDDAA